MLAEGHDHEGCYYSLRLAQLVWRVQRLLLQMRLETAMSLWSEQAELLRRSVSALMSTASLLAASRDVVTGLANSILTVIVRR